MHLQFSRNEVRFLREDVTVLPDARDLAGLFQLAQRLVQSHANTAFPAELFRQFRLVERPQYFGARIKARICCFSSWFVFIRWLPED